MNGTDKRILLQLPLTVDFGVMAFLSKKGDEDMTERITPNARKLSLAIVGWMGVVVAVVMELPIPAQSQAAAVPSFEVAVTEVKAYRSDVYKQLEKPQETSANP